MAVVFETVESLVLPTPWLCSVCGAEFVSGDWSGWVQHDCRAPVAWEPGAVTVEVVSGYVFECGTCGARWAVGPDEPFMEHGCPGWAPVEPLYVSPQWIYPSWCS